MHPLRISTVCLAAFAALVMGCGRDSLSPPNGGAQPEFARGAATAKPYLVTFAGDIAGSFVKLLNPKDPLASVALDGETLSFANSGSGGTTTAGNITVCLSADPRLIDPSWGGYAGASWIESPDPSYHSSLSVGKGNSSGLLFLGSQNDSDGGWINLRVKGPVDQIENLAGGVVRHHYRDDRAEIGAGSWHTDPTQPDPTDRCISFTVTATPQ